MQGMTEIRREELWAKIKSLLVEYPEILENWKKGFEEWGDDCENCGFVFDPDSPAYIDGLVFIVHMRNMQNAEGRIVLSPPGQSRFITSGLIEEGY